MKIVLAAILTLIVYTAFAQKAPAAPEQTNVDLQILANKLVKYGYQTKAALPLIQAVEIYKRLGISDETDPQQKTTVTDAIVEDTTQKHTVVSFNIEQLIADASKYADGNKNLLSLIKSLDKTRGRTGIGGPIRHYDSVNAHSTDTYRIKFRGANPTIIIVSGDGDTDLDLYVYDVNGNLIASDTDLTDDCVVTFTPRWTETFIVKVVNRGSVYNRYCITTN